MKATGPYQPLILRILHGVIAIVGMFAIVAAFWVREEWLEGGELEHIWYYLHLGAWLILVSGLLFHLTMGLKVGGLPLITSMLGNKIKPSDSPRLWREKINHLWFDRRR